MSGEWKTGDVGLVIGVGGERTYPAVYVEGGDCLLGCATSQEGRAHWHAGGGSMSDQYDARPIVVLDPEEAEQVERLADAFGECDHDARCTTCLTAALRELASPTPPKPVEPQGRFAVIEDREGKEWVRKGVRWHYGAPRSSGMAFSHWVTRDYADLDVVRVLSEGVTS